MWVLHAVLYCLSLSSLLLGLSAAQGDAEEFSLIFTQPISRSGWLAGKTAALAALLGPASALLIVPTALTSGSSASLVAVAAAAGGVCLALALLGMAVGFWIRDHVRGLLAALGLWFLLLFGTDLVLLALAGAPWAQARQDSHHGAKENSDEAPEQICRGEGNGKSQHEVIERVQLCLLSKTQKAHG